MIRYLPRSHDSAPAARNTEQQLVTRSDEINLIKEFPGCHVGAERL